MTQRLSKAEWDEWVINPVTQAYNEWLHTALNEVLNQWGRADLNRPIDQIAASTIRARAQLETIKRILDCDLEKLNSRDEE